MAPAKKKRLYGLRDLENLPQLTRLGKETLFAMKTVAHALPFRVNNYILEELIDWEDIPDDPIFQLCFPQKGMLEEEDFDRIAGALRAELPQEILQERIRDARLKLNPHPAGQLSANVPYMNDEPVRGVQHKYRETCLVFPSNGQTCYAYCTFCFRWPQFTDLTDLKFATDESNRFLTYIKKGKSLTDVLITGGDPMIMHADILARYIEPLLSDEYEHIRSIRIGTKSLGHWPYRFITDPDAEKLLKLFERVAQAGKQLAFMAHFSHPRELATDAAREAVRRIRDTGAVIRSQSPLIRHINDSPEIWSSMWRKQVQLGIIPYYQFIERNTGPRRYFEVPLAEALDIYSRALSRVSGLARTVRGPSMSAHPGKICVDGITEIQGEKVFALSFLQARNPAWIKRPFFAVYDAGAVWLDDLKPAFGEKVFFFTEELHRRHKVTFPKPVLQTDEDEDPDPAAYGSLR